MPTAEPRYTKETLAQLGTALYAEKIRPLLRVEDNGKFVAMDTVSGDYELDDDDYTAITRLRTRRPDCANLARNGRPADGISYEGGAMIRGVVTVYREPVVPLRIRRPNGPEVELRVVVDTGFTGLLTIPIGTVAALGLPHESASRSALADGSMTTFDVFSAEIEWDGSWRPVTVSAVGDESLLGMKLMAGHKLEIAVVPGGAVTIRPLN